MDTCLYYIFNSTGNYEISNRTLASCVNATFNVSDEQTYTLYLYVNDSFGNATYSNVTFAVNTKKPVVVLSHPNIDSVDNRWTNDADIYFNFTGTYKAGLSECYLLGNWTADGSLSSQYVWTSPTNNTMNSTLIDYLTDAKYKWNVRCFGTDLTSGYGLNNLSFGLDTIEPNVTITSITTATGNQVFSFTFLVSDINLNSTSCKYTIFNGTIVNGVENTTITSCTSPVTTAVVSAFGTYNLTLYVKDLAGNENSTTEEFTVRESAGGLGGGGGGPGTVIVEKIVESNKTFCGDGICQNKVPNDLNLTEDFFSCPLDCAGFNIDTTTFFCFDNDGATQCVWESLKAKYVGLFMGILIALLSFTTVEEPKTKRQISLFKYTKNKFKKKVKYYRK